MQPTETNPITPHLPGVRENLTVADKTINGPLCGVWKHDVATWQTPSERTHFLCRHDGSF